MKKSGKKIGNMQQHTAKAQQEAVDALLALYNIKTHKFVLSKAQSSLQTLVALPSAVSVFWRRGSF